MDNHRGGVLEPSNPNQWHHENSTNLTQSYDTKAFSGWLLLRKYMFLKWSLSLPGHVVWLENSFRSWKPVILRWEDHSSVQTWNDVRFFTHHHHQTAALRLGVCINKLWCLLAALCLAPLHQLRPRHFGLASMLTRLNWRQRMSWQGRFHNIAHHFSFCKDMMASTNLSKWSSKVAK